MKFGLRYCNIGRYAEAAAAVELLQAAEEAGFESAWTVEHTVVPKGYASRYPFSADGRMAGGVDDFPLPDPIVWLSYMAAATTRLRLATGILILPQHNPVVIAKQIATLDALSNGRVLLGVGVGWLAEEFAALGADFATRGAAMDEYVAALRVLWRDDCASYHGRFVDFTDLFCRPRPVHRAVPIIVGGHTPAAARRAGRIADGFFPARGTSAELIAIARAAAAEAGRDPAALEITASCPEALEDLAALAALGVSRVLVPVTPMPGLKAAIDGPADALAWRGRIERYAET